VISGIERGLQAAFVDFGPEKHGFLPLRDVMPETYRVKPKDKTPDIKEVLAKKQELLVQVEHDQRGTKGASLTNRISLPGRYMVMMPGKERLCISRKIEDKDARDRMKDAFKGLRVPKNMGFILRTAGAGRKTKELADDLRYLTKLWNKINREAKKAQPPALIYKEEDIAVRTVRDYLTEDVTEVIVDEPKTAKRVKDFLKQTMPGRSMNVTLYKDKKPLFDQYGLEA
jgi:ribonuclease E